MIEVTRLNGTTVVINADLIEMVEATPDTVITTITGRKLVLADSVETIIERVIAYRRAVGARCRQLVVEPASSAEDEV